jgi:hypothetical protein
VCVCVCILMRGRTWLCKRWSGYHFAHSWLCIPGVCVCVCVSSLLSGKLCFFGDLEKALEYFENLGYRCPNTTNPADYFQELIDMPDQYAIPDQEWAEISASRTVPMVRPTTAEGFVEAYKQSEFAEQARSEIQELSVSSTHKSFLSRPVEKDSSEYFAQYPQPLHVQTKVC